MTTTTDHRPERAEGPHGRQEWYWFRGPACPAGYDMAAVIPPNVYSRLRDGLARSHSAYAFPTRHAALLALAAALTPES